LTCPTGDYNLGSQARTASETEYLSINTKFLSIKITPNPLTLPPPFFWLGGLKYKILAFIQTKNVEKLEITSKKRHRTAYLPEQSS
jgi:hypothetical protein